MSASDPHNFLTLSEREYSCGTASAVDNKLVITDFQFVPGKDFDDSVNELKNALKTPDALLVQASIPFALVTIPTPCDAATLADLAQKASGMDAEDMRLVPVTLGQGKCVAVISKKELASRSAQAESMGAQGAKVFCRGLSVISSLQRRFNDGTLDKPVLYLDVEPSQSRLFLVQKDSAKDLGVVDSGTGQILEQVMDALGLKFPGSAAKLFYGDLYDFDDHAAKLIAPLVEKATPLAEKADPGPAYLYASGLPASRTVLLCGKLAEAFHLAPAPVKVTLDAQGATVPAYISDSFIGISPLIAQDAQSVGLVDLSQPAQDAAAILSTQEAKPAEAAKAPVAVAKEEAPKPAEPPAPKQEVAQEKKPQAKEAPVKKDAPAPAEKPAAKAPVKDAHKPAAPAAPAKPQPKSAPAPAKPAAKDAPAKKPEAPKPAAAPVKKPVPPASEGGNGKKFIIIGGVAVAIVVIALIAVFAGGGDKKAPAPAPVVETQPVAEEMPEARTDESAVTGDAALSDSENGSEAQAADGAIVQDEPVAEPEPEEPPPPTTGSLSVQTTPIDAQIYVDGELMGSTPAILNDLPVGTCQVELRKENYEPQTVTVEIVGGQTEGLNGIVLAMRSGSIDVSTSPIGVPYEITPMSVDAGASDPAQLRGTTPLKVDGLRPGSYKVTFKRSGWKAYESEVTVAPGKTASALFDYQPGTAVIDSTPSGASVTINGEKVGVTPLELGELPEGPLSASLDLDGYEPETVSLDIPFGGSDSSQSTLLPLDRLITRATDLDILPTHAGGNELPLPASLIEGHTGRVFIRFVISAEGTVENATLASTNPFSEKATAKILSEVRQWTFTPGSRKGFVMRVEVVMPVEIRAE